MQRKERHLCEELAQLQKLREAGFDCSKFFKGTSEALHCLPSDSNETSRWERVYDVLQASAYVFTVILVG